MRDKVQVVLTSDQAISIFLEKYKEGNFPSQTAKSIELASTYGIDPKTVRDIWCGRSWLETTYDLWQQVSISKVKYFIR